jgi:hypothetical protein
MALMGTVDYTPFEFLMLFAVFALGFLCFFQMYYVYPALILFVVVFSKLLLKGFSGPKDKYSHKVCIFILTLVSSYPRRSILFYSSLFFFFFFFFSNNLFLFYRISIFLMLIIMDVALIHGNNKKMPAQD